MIQEGQRPSVVTEGQLIGSIGGVTDDRKLSGDSEGRQFPTSGPDVALGQAAAAVVADAEAFVAELAPAARPPRRLVDRFVDLLAIELVDDGRIVDGLRGGRCGTGDRLRRAAARRRFAAKRLDELAADADGLDAHRDRLLSAPSLGLLRLRALGSRGAA